MRRHLGVLAVLAISLLIVSRAERSVAAEPLLPAETYRENIPEPSEFVGFPFGERHWTHDQVDAYVRALAEASERVELVEYAKTFDRKPLVALTISSPENLSRIEEIQQVRQTFADPSREEVPEVEDVPLVAWFEYGVHGDEPSATHAGVLVAYYLAASEDPDLAEFLAKNVIVLDPCLNPDGFDRFSRWSNLHRGIHPSPDVQSREHRQGWPAGRMNYYGFDLNRDWLPAQQPESQGRLELYRRWQPNALFDFHEMDGQSTYFFQPGVPSRNNPLTPQRNFELTKQLSDRYAATLDGTGDLYFTEEKFDDFYPGKGSTYPDLHGGVGVLFEQASARGVKLDSRGGELTLRETSERQVRTSLAALEGIAALRDELVAWQRQFYREAKEAATNDNVRGYLLRIPHDPARREAMTALLDRHGVEWSKLAQPIDRDGITFGPEDSIFVSLRQRDYLFVKSIFERRTTFLENAFYDVSAWNVAAAFGAQLVEMTEDLPEGLLASGGPLEDEGAPAALPLARVAYLIDLRSSAAYGALSKLFQAEIRLLVATQPFSIENHGQRRELPPGTVMVTIADQKVSAEAIHAALAPLADEDLEVIPIMSSRTLEGSDLGSDDWKAVPQPKVALIGGKDISAYDAADFWFALDQRAELPASLLDLDDLLDLSFEPYTVVIFPDGDYRRFPSRKIADLTTWQKGGGTIILQGRAIAWGATQGLAVVTEPSVAPAPSGEDPYALPQKPYAGAADAKAVDDITGVILKAQVDPTHPIGYGFVGNEAYVFRSQGIFFEPSRNAYANPLILAKDPVFAGYVSPRNRERLAGGLSVSVQWSGEGRTILFADEPCFRAYFRGSERAFLNAVYFGPIVEDPS
ncbi:MAG TPA: M14 family zinc carboxypeptidase [Pirellulaceae bacterium]|nr:M14 family zinc carboxypeptidase [Pirellulaceae bacterium]